MPEDDSMDITVVTAIDAGLRDAMALKKTLMAEVPGKLGNPRLNHTHYRTLNILSNNGPGCMKTCCRHLGLEAGSFTPVADRLIEEGLILRERDSGDRRRVLLNLTDEGRRTIGRVQDVILEQMARKLSALDADLIEDLTTGMEAVRRAVEQLRGQNDE